MPRRRATRQPKTVSTIRHKEASRPNIPTAEHQPVMTDDEQRAIPVAYPRNTDLDPQLVWRGKDAQDQSDLTAHAPPLYIQEKIHPKVLIDGLMNMPGAAQPSPRPAGGPQGGQSENPQYAQPDLFADFNGFPEGADPTKFYQHEGNWSNRMILGDSLQVMASLAEREGLRGKVQCIYLDPPYGIKFNSNFQWSTTSRDVRDGNAAHVTREPEQVKAFRDTWRDGIHSYLSYLRDRLTVARDLLAESGSIFVQIGDENVHRVRGVMDEVFGEGNFIAVIAYRVFGVRGGNFLDSVTDNIIWYGKDIDTLKYRQLFLPPNEPPGEYQPVRLYRPGFSEGLSFEFSFKLRSYRPPGNMHWATGHDGLRRLQAADRLIGFRADVRYKRFTKDFPSSYLTTSWQDTWGEQNKSYVVQTSYKVIQRCILMTTAPGDLVLDPTCGAGTTAYVAEQWGRRWITIDTSRVALALARARIMGARYPYYLLADSKAGQEQEAKLSRRLPSEEPTYGDIRQGFVYQRVPHITLRAIANNAEIDVIWEQYERQLAPLREQLSVVSGAWSVASGPHPSPPPEQAPGERTTVPRRSGRTTGGHLPSPRRSGRTTGGHLPSPRRNGGTTGGPTPLEEWQVPRERPDDWPAETEPLLAEFWELRIARQREIDASIAAKADYENLYDQPYEDRKTVRVAGQFTVESISPHRTLAVGEDGEFIAEAPPGYGPGKDFATVILDNLRTAGVQQAHKEDRIEFTSLTPWPGHRVCAEGQVSGQESQAEERRAAIFIGPEFGTVSRPDLVEAARESAEAGFDLLIACAFNYDAHSTEFERLGRIPVLKARMNNDLHMANDLKNTGHGNLFVIFGEPDIAILDAADGQVQVKVNGVDVFHPNTGEVRSDGPEGIACWFIDTDYNEESFFVRHAYFLGASDPYKSLKTTLKAEINAEAWATLKSDTSRPFPRPESERIAVKVINHLGDEVMKVFRVERD